MKIIQCKVNHMTNPLGFAIDHPVFSWKVCDAEGNEAVSSRIVIKDDNNIIKDSGWTTLNSLGTEVDINLKPRTRYTWYAAVKTNQAEEAQSEEQYFETGKMSEPWSGKWITVENQQETRHPVFFKDFKLHQKPVEARLYICGLGLYEANINGQKVNEELLCPDCNDYDRWLQVQTYDVTSFLKEDNRIEVLLGNGWYRGRFGFDASNTAPAYGQNWKMIAEMHVRYEDGSEEVLNSDDSWQVKRSAILFSNIYDGEKVDQTLPETDYERVILSDEPAATLQDRRSLAVTMHEVFTPSVLHTPKNETVLDTSQNMAGTFRLHVHVPKGTMIHLQFGEVLQDDCFYRDNLRSAKAEYIFISDGSDQWIQPHFTYYGYRYVKVEGMDNIKPEDFQAIAIYSNFAWRGSVQTGNELINRLLLNCEWGMKSNYVDVPTDCPQRDERMGWTGDAQVFSPTALYFADPYAFLSKYLYDMSLEQKDNNGAVPFVVPDFHIKNTASVWGDATCIIPMNMYKADGDKKILEDHYPAMLAWVNYIKGIDGENHHWRDVFHFGDWLALDGAKGPEAVRGATDEAFIADIYYRHSVLLCAETAHILGYQEDEKKLRDWADRIAKGINEEFYTPNGRCAIETMTGMILSLHEGFGDQKKCTNKLLELLSMNQNKLATGFVGTPLLCDVLSQAGHIEEAYDLLFNEDYPGWLYEVKHGATTIWERWNSINPDGHISGTGMNSLNHYSYGSIAEWIFKWCAGIDQKEPGYTKAWIHPHVDTRLGYLKAEYDSSAGLYEVSWKIMDKWHLHIEVTVPFGCKAVIDLPFSTQHIEVRTGHYVYEYETERPIGKFITLQSSVTDALKNQAVKEYLEKLPLFAQSEYGMQNNTLKDGLRSCRIEDEVQLKKIEKDLIDLQ